MKALKWTGVAGIILLGVILIVGLFAPGHVEMKGTALINAPDSIVFDQVNNLKHWESWSPFLEADTTMRNQYHGPDDGVGAQMIWESRTSGDGMMIITQSEPYRTITMRLDFMKDGLALSEWSFAPNSNGVEVTWTTTVDDLSYPMGRIMGLFMNKMMQSYYKNGFKNLEIKCQEEMLALQKK